MSFGISSVTAPSLCDMGRGSLKKRAAKHLRAGMLCGRVARLGYRVGFFEQIVRKGRFPSELESGI